jgi:acetyl esterase/lipase
MERRVWRLIASLLMVILLSACSALQVISSTSPSSHYQKTEGIRYSEGERGRLDLYEPKALSPDAPTVVFFYGGGWRNGSRGKYEFVASALTRAGFRVVIPDYRIYPEVQFPEFMIDGARAVAWTERFLEESGATVTEIYLMGHSAGAQIAALLATDRRYLDQQSVPPEAIVGLIGLSGPYDFLPLQSGYLEQVFPDAVRADSQPIDFVSPEAPSTLLIHGEDDEVVEPGNSRRLAEALLDAGVEVRLELYPGTGHATVAAALAPRLDFLADTLEDTIRFIKDREAVSDSPGRWIEP